MAALDARSLLEISVKVLGLTVQVDGCSLLEISIKVLGLTVQLAFLIEPSHQIQLICLANFPQTTS